MSNPAIYRLVCAAVRFADAVERLDSVFSEDDDFMRRDQDLIEATIAFAKTLSPIDRARLGR